MKGKWAVGGIGRKTLRTAEEIIRIIEETIRIIEEETIRSLNSSLKKPISSK